MRELKFRIWDIKNKYYGRKSTFATGEWVYSYTTQLTDEIIDDNNSGINVVVQQYTGLKDKDSKEIYEGDILDDAFDKNFGVVKFGEYASSSDFTINDIANGWYIYYCKEREYALTAGYASALGVLGNIYETPELLGEEHVKFS